MDVGQWMICRDMRFDSGRIKKRGLHPRRCFIWLKTRRQREASALPLMQLNHWAQGLLAVAACGARPACTVKELRVEQKGGNGNQERLSVPITNASVLGLKIDQASNRPVYHSGPFLSSVKHPARAAVTLRLEQECERLGYGLFIVWICCIWPIPPSSCYKQSLRILLQIWARIVCFLVHS